MRKEDYLRPGERLDELQRNGYSIIQDPGRFCFGMDAVLLSGFARVKPGERAIDLGTGTGIIPILLEAKTIARHEVLCSLEDVIRESARLLKPGGRLYMVHRPFRLAEIISLMVQYRVEPKRMKLVYPYVDKEPNMVLIEGLRGGKPRMTVEKPLIVYQEPGKYTDEIYDIYGY